MELNYRQFSHILKEFCFGEWPEPMPIFTEDDNFEHDEDGNIYPMGQETADKINNFLAKMKELGAPAPFTAYTHCGTPFIEWSDWEKNGKNYETKIALEFWKEDEAIVSHPNTDSFFIILKD